LCFYSVIMRSIVCVCACLLLVTLIFVILLTMFLSLNYANFREITECPFLQHPTERVYFQHHQEANRTGVFPPKIISLSPKLKNPAPSNVTLTGCTSSSLKTAKFAGYLCWYLCINREYSECSLCVRLQAPEGEGQLLSSPPQTRYLQEVTSSLELGRTVTFHCFWYKKNSGLSMIYSQQCHLFTLTAPIQSKCTRTEDIG